MRHLISSIALTISLVGCAGLKKFPTDRIIEVDMKSKVCGEYKITDAKNLKFKWVRDIPFEQCPSTFGFTSADIPKVLNWAQDAQSYVEKNCK